VNRPQKEKRVFSLTRIASTATIVAVFGGPLGAAPAFAQAPAVSPATASISGTVLDPAALPVVGATVELRGASSAKTTTDAQGHYGFLVPPGVYSVTVTKAGLLPATEEDVALTAGGVKVDVRMQRPTFTSLSTIGSTRTVGANTAAPQFNTTPASQQIIGQQTFENQGDLQVRDILDETPGIVASISNGSANGGVPGAITFPQIRGGLSYETATLIDGHPVSVGEYGDYVSTFLNRFLFQSIELEKGPGAVTPLVSRAINGTVNFRTWDPTPTLTGNAEFGVDGYGGKYANLRFSDTVANGKLGFVFDYADWGTPGPAGNDDPQSFIDYGASGNSSFTDSQGNPVTISPITKYFGPGTIANKGYLGYQTGTIACCIDMPTWYENRAFLGKLRYNFSNSTSLTLTEISTQTLSSQNGNTSQLYYTNFNPTSGPLAAGTREAFNPYNDSFAQDYEINNEPMFEGELRTSLGNDNILFRAYNASISRLQTNGDPAGTTMTQPVYLYGSTASGSPLNGLDPFGKPYTMTITDPTYQSNEIDDLTGYSFEYDHLLGSSGNVVTLAADENYSETHVYVPGTPDVNSSPTSDIPSGTAIDTGTYFLRGNFQLTPKLSLVAGYYLTRFGSNFAQWYEPTGQTFYNINFTNEVYWHQDDRAALAYRLDHDTSLRAAAGSGVVPPYPGILNGSFSAPSTCGSFVRPGGAANNCPLGAPFGYNQTLGGGLNVRPETSFGYDIGGDHRMQDGTTVISGDLYLTNLHNQFLKATYQDGLYNGAAGLGPLFVTSYSNLSNSRYEGIELAINHAPISGWGYIVQASLMHDYPYDISSAEAAAYPGLVSGVNFGPDSLLSNTRTPYSQGYAEINYRNAGFYWNVGALYLGNNNSYNEPAFAVLRSSVRVPLFHNYGNGDPHGNTYLQFSVDNIANVHSMIFDENYQGVQYPANNPNEFFVTDLKGYGPRQFRLDIGHNFR
jgi:hypothetical protein